MSAPRAGPAVLYVSYDGALDPLGRSQVVPYVEGLAALGWRFHLLTFEKDARWAEHGERSAMEERLAASGVTWHPMRYHKRPPVAATARDIAAGLGAARRLHACDPLALVHARSYPSALIALGLRSASGVPFLFDMRGFYPEERVDGGLWRAGGPVFQVAKHLERDFLGAAAGVVTLTEASVPIVVEAMERAGGRGELAVIPTSVDLERFALRPMPGGPFTLAYFGSVGTWYLLDEMMKLGRAVLDEVGDSRLLFVVNDGAEAVRTAAAAARVPAERLTLTSVPHERVPEALAEAHATYFLIRPEGSKVASAATKFGESLALGRPVAANRGVGDTAAVIEEDGVGVVVEALGDDEYRRVARALAARAGEPGMAKECRQVAQARYALDAAVEAYARLYRAMGVGEGRA